MTRIQPEHIALVKSLLPSAATTDESDGGYGWNDTYIQSLMDARSFTPTEAVRFFWLQRVNETAEYINVGKPLGEIHRQARDMLAYWDAIIKQSPEAIEPVSSGGTITFGEIERPWADA